MRYHHLRFDIWLCLLFSVLLAMGAEKIASKFLVQKYEVHKEEHKVGMGEIGGKATEEVFRAQNIEDLLSHDTFTVISPGIEYRNKGAGYYKGMYLYALTSPTILPQYEVLLDLKVLQSLKHTLLEKHLLYRRH